MFKGLVNLTEGRKIEVEQLAGLPGDWLGGCELCLSETNAKRPVLLMRQLQRPAAFGSGPGETKGRNVAPCTP